METTILGLSFSTRMTGLAVFKSHSLIDYSLKLHKEKWSPQKREMIIASLGSCVDNFTITSIALSIPDEHQQTSAFKQLQEDIESFADSHRIPVTRYTAKEVYQRFSPVKRTRNALMKRLVILFPELSLYYEREQTNRNKYYVKLFEAIGVAAIHSQQ